jgi:opacity protein-like surface antigen
MKIKLLAGLVALAAISNIAIAAAPGDPIYVDANIGLNTSWNTLGLNADVGYMFNRYVGVEGGLTYSPGYSYNSGPYSYSSSYYMLDAAVKGVLPLSQVFSIYGKLGLGYNNYSSWDNPAPAPAYYGSNVGILIGAGAEFNLTKNWSLQVEDYTVTGPNPNFLMFGGKYRF